MTSKAATGDGFKVFVSYSRDDLLIADQIAAGLRLLGFEPLLDRHGIAGAEAWRERLSDLILESDTVAFLLSPSAIASETCAWEVAEATRLSKRVIPVMVAPIGATPPPERLRALNYIHFYAEPSVPGSGFGAGLAALVTALRTDVEWVREHTRLGQRANEWHVVGRPDNRLLSGGDIAEARRWASRRPTNAPEPTELHLDFLRASEQAEVERASAERRRLEEMAAAQSQRAAALERAEAAQRREIEVSRFAVRRTRAAAIVSLAFATLATGAAGFAFTQWREAVTAREDAQAALTIAEDAAEKARLSAEREHQQAAAAERARAAAVAGRARLIELTTRVQDVLRDEDAVFLVGFDRIERKLAQIFVEQQELALAEQSDAAPEIVARTKYRLGQLLEARGESLAAQRLYEEAYATIRQRVDAAAAVGPVPTALVVALAEIINYGAWSLMNAGELDRAAARLEHVSQLRRGVDDAEMDVEALRALAGVENAISRLLGDRKDETGALEHARQALALTTRAQALAPTSLRLAEAALIFHENIALHLDRLDRVEEADAERATGCRDALAVAAGAPFSYARTFEIRCALIEAKRLRRVDKFAEAIAALAPHREALEQMIATAADDINLMTLRLQITGEVVDILQLTPTEKEAYQAEIRRLADEWIATIGGRASLPSDLWAIRSAYDSLKGAEITDDAERAAFFTRLSDGIAAALEAFPDVRVYQLIGAHSALQAGEAHRKAGSNAAVISGLLTRSWDFYRRSRILTELSTFSESFADACRALGQQIIDADERKNIEEMTRLHHLIRSECGPALEKYPFDFYLRQHIDGSAMRLGKALFAAQRFDEARPFLEHMSHWGISSTELAHLYREGVGGVDKDEARADALMALDSKQSMKRFTVPLEISGSKFPFELYVRQWPDDYPYEGVDDQAEWLKAARGLTVPEDVLDRFRKLHRIARENDVSFPELAVYALDEAQREAGKEGRRNRPRALGE